MNYNINEVLRDLYDALVKIKYPAIVQYDLTNLESTVLAKENRRSLLHWILLEFFKTAQTTEDPPTANDESSILQWYKWFCVCIKEEALLGQCPLEGQLSALFNLTKFINIIVDVGKNDSTTSDIVWDILPKWVDDKKNIIPSSCNLGNKLSYKETTQYVKTVSDGLKDSENNLRSETDTVEMCDNKTPEKIQNGVDLPKKVLNTKIVDEFLEVFQSDNASITSKNHEKSLDKSIEEIHSKFSTLNQTLLSKIQLSRTEICTELNIVKSDLDSVIHNTVIAFENLSKIQETDETKNQSSD